ATTTARRPRDDPARITREEGADRRHSPPRHARRARLGPPEAGRSPGERRAPGARRRARAAPLREGARERAALLPPRPGALGGDAPQARRVAGGVRRETGALRRDRLRHAR